MTIEDEGHINENPQEQLRLATEVDCQATIRREAIGAAILGPVAAIIGLAGLYLIGQSFENGSHLDKFLQGALTLVIATPFAKGFVDALGEIGRAKNVLKDMRISPKNNSAE